MESKDRTVFSSLSCICKQAVQRKFALSGVFLYFCKKLKIAVFMVLSARTDLHGSLQLLSIKSVLFVRSLVQVN